MAHGPANYRDPLADRNRSKPADAGANGDKNGPLLGFHRAKGTALVSLDRKGILAGKSSIAPANGFWQFSRGLGDHPERPR